MTFFYRPIIAVLNARPRLRKRAPRLTKEQVVQRFNEVRPTDEYRGRITILEHEKWEPLHAGTLGAIFYHPKTGQRWLYCIDYNTGLPRRLKALAPRQTARPLLLSWGGRA